MKKLIVVIFFLIPFSVYAENNLGIQEPLKQGGLYVGKVAVGDKVTFHGERVKISPEGYFAFGLGWKYKDVANIRVDHKAGGHTMYHLDVIPHDYQVEEITGLPSQYVTPPQEVLNRISKDATDVRAVRTTDSDLQNFREEIIWPVEGRIVSRFGPKADGLHNDGINIAVPEGSPVRAAQTGVVAYAGNELRGYGNLLLVRHSNGWMTAYAHNGELLVQRGATVTKGQTIALAGRTGSVQTAQVHFEIRRGSQALDPIKAMSS